MSDAPPTLQRPAAPLTDGIVTLDTFTREDALDIVEAMDDEILRWLPLPDPYGETEARGFIDAPPNTVAEGEALNFAVRWQGRLAGSVGVSAERPSPGQAQIGYWVAPHARNRGVGRRAVRLLAQHTFATYAPARIEILVHPDNVASRRTAEAAGAVFEGIREEALPMKDGTSPAAVYALFPASAQAQSRR